MSETSLKKSGPQQGLKNEMHDDVRVRNMQAKAYERTQEKHACKF